MVTIAQRIEKLRTERNLSRPALAAALGLPRTAIEKFEMGCLTPTQAQQEKLAAYFEISVAELRGADQGMSQWMDGAFLDAPTAPEPKPRPAVRAAAADGDGGASGSMMDALLGSKKFQQAMQAAALEVLRSPEGQEILANVVRKELNRNR